MIVREFRIRVEMMQWKSNLKSHSVEFSIECRHQHFALDTNEMRNELQGKYHR